VTVRNSDGGVKQAEVVVDLSDRAHRGARAAAGRLLLDGNGRTQALNRVYVGPLHLVEELAGIGGERLHITALAFRIDDVEGEAGFART